MEQISKALVKAQSGFRPALKTSTNPHFKSKYADLGACIEAVIDSLNDNGIALIQKSTESLTGITIETVFLHESGESFSGGLLFVPAPKNDPQGFGSALTYARRYSLMAACGIAPEDDDGNSASFTRSKPKRESVQMAKEDDPWTTKTVETPLTVEQSDIATALEAEESIAHCEHGQRKRVEGIQKDGVTPYMGHICALPKDAPASEKCLPIWFEISPSGKWREKVNK